MPVRTYTGIDLINYTEEFTLDTGSTPAVATPAGQGRVTVTSSDLDSFSGEGSANPEAEFVYKMRGELDFNVFPSIPSNAIITNVRIKINGTVSGIASASASGLNASASANGKVGIVVEINDNEFLDDLFTGNEAVDPGNGSADILISEENHYTQEKVYDFSGAPINKAALVALLDSISFYVGTIDITATPSDLQANAMQIID